MRTQAGFTLIEIVMVLVLLGILAAVAAPKYFDYQDAAEQRAALATVAEAQARLEATFGEKLLEGKSCAEAISYAGQIKNLADDGNSAFGEYSLAYGDRGYLTVRRDNRPILTNASFVYPACEDAAGAISGNTLFNNDFAQYIETSARGAGTMTWQFNSAYDGNQLRDMTRLFTENASVSLQELGAQTWAYTPKSNNANDGGYFFWTSQENSAIQSMPIDTKIPVVVYDTQKKTYTVADATIRYDLGSTTFKILTLSNVPVSNTKGSVKETDILAAEYAQMKNSSHTAAEALAVYNALVAGSSQ
ncbi:MAG: type II secretion system protein [Desulfovibrionaceae bacterium]